nr:alpha/beta hydrolase [Paracoccus sp. S-4012]
MIEDHSPRETAVIARDLPEQTPINPAADAYAETALLRSSGVPRIADIPFGADPEQRLDVYLPHARPQPGAGWPVFVFWHGGGFTHGHKEWCGFMAPAVTALPAILVSANYRLIPRAHSEQQMDDARAAIRWVMDNIGQFGGDRRRLVIGGHSAGGNIAARLELDAGRRRAAGIPDGAIKAVLPMSGSYATRTGSLHPDPARRLPSDSPDCAAEFDHSSAAPFTVCWGTKERDPFPQNGAAFADLLESRGMEVRRLPIEGADHFAVHLAAGDRDNLYFQAVAAALARSGAEVLA